MRDIVFLVPDKNTEYTVRGAIGRHAALGIRPIDCDVIVDPGRDGGVRARGKTILDLERSRFHHAVMILDYEGSGTSGTADQLQLDLDAQLATAWADAAKVIVVRPEIDIWMWGNDTHLHHVLGSDFGVGVRTFLKNAGFLFDENNKPQRPKEALETAFRQVRLPRSSAMYRDLASRLSLANCTDTAFRRLQEALVRWFPA